ncbi:MAG TPA: universal stress protein [Conexibacter sp.]|jgi:nucleotide-binding universal stress UspA family protein|nr:universal stress protein [Conexibacter sp.]
MTRTIVVGYDGSDHGDDALALGRLLAGIAADAELVVACAYPDDPLGESAAALEMAQGMREDAERTLERARAWLAGAGGTGDAGGTGGAGPAAANGGVSLRAIAGASPSHVLHGLAEQLGAAAIVIGATHHGRALRLLTGSTPEAVLNHAPCPVAVAPEGFRDAHPSAPRQLGVAFDGSPEAQHTLAVAADFARSAGARLRVVTAVNSAAAGVYPPPPLDVVAYEELSELARAEARQRLDDAIASLAPDVQAEGAVLDGDTVTMLVADAAGDDLLFTGSRGQGPFRRVLVGSISAHLLRDAPCPVVVVPRGSGEGGSEAA